MSEQLPTELYRGIAAALGNQVPEDYSERSSYYYRIQLQRKAARSLLDAYAPAGLVPTDRIKQISQDSGLSQRLCCLLAAEMGLRLVTEVQQRCDWADKRGCRGPVALCRRKQNLMRTWHLCAGHAAEWLGPAQRSA